MKDSISIRERKRLLKLFSTITIISLFTVSIVFYYGAFIGSTPILKLPTCPTVEKYIPDNYSENKPILNKIINDETFRNQSVIKMQHAVQIDTSSYDDAPLDVGNNLDKFAHFNIFHIFLKETFPLFHKHLELHIVNHFGLVYIWKGSDASLKPLVLMAHQDVVPISPDSLKEWIHDPFSGDYDGKYLYGRGSGDCKNLLIAHFEAVEELIKIEFKPKRTVIFSYGFDEEIIGQRNQNGQYIEQLFGKDSIYAVMDEGGVSMMDIGNTTMAVIGTGEKGYLDLSISIQKKGGHSSVPQDHTAIGIMGDLIVQIENDKFPLYFTDYNPTFWQYVCLAENSVDIDATLKHDILYSQINEKSNLNVLQFINKDRLTSYAIKTTQALDVIHGGVKNNALPEFVELIINSRVALEENIEIAFNKFLKDTEIIANKYNLGLNVKLPYGNDTEEYLPSTDIGILTIKPILILEPSPITPISDRHWEIFAGTVRHIYEDVAYPKRFNGSNNDKIIVTPGLGTGNTDTKLYWNLTKHIYRYRPGVLPSVTANSHGINEYIEFDSHLQIIAFIFQYIQSVDQEKD
jgi:Gly-Xaa carboxypeptidase